MEMGGVGGGVLGAVPGLLQEVQESGNTQFSCPR